MLDHSKTLLFVGLMLFVVIMVTNSKRPTAATPLDPSQDVGDSQTANDQSDITPQWAANVPSLSPPPLSLMMPETGTQPV